MKLNNIRRLSREDLSGAPSWIDPLLLAYNAFMEQGTQAISGNLTYGDNLLCRIVTNSFQSGVEVITKNPFKNNLRPIGLHPIAIDGQKLIDSFRFDNKQSGEVGITFNYKGDDCFYSVGLTANQSIPDNIPTPILFDNLRETFNDNFTFAGTQINCNVSGVYDISYTVTYDANATGVRTSWVSKNGVITGSGSQLARVSNSPGASVVSYSSSVSMRFERDDYLQIYALQDSMVALNILGNAAAETNLNIASVNGTGNSTANITYILIGG